jgi:transketolase
MSTGTTTFLARPHGDGGAQGSPSVASRRLANALRMLAVDAVEQANSGHPGAPMGMADIAEVLWRRHLRHNPADPQWPDRDRFVLSNGHGSMLLYGLLHLTGYDLPMDELRRFRQLHSKTPGHPEVGLTPGVETTTGPLGQGLANAVGMALAEKLLAAEFNRPGHAIVDHMSYAFAGDGCLMEGISHEACSLAGTLRPSKLVVVYDDNGISIDGDVRGWFTDDTPRRFESYGWHVIADVDGHDAQAVDAALEQARAQAQQPDGRPTLICCRTVIGQGAPNKAGGHDVHGAALGAAEVAATRAALDWTAAPFQIPPDIAAAWDARTRGAQAHAEWSARMDAYRAEHPALAAEFERRMAGELPDHFADRLPALLAAVPVDTVATRKASQRALDALAPLLPELFGGSADLTGSNLTNFKGCVAAGRDRPGNHLSWGVREFGMAAALNGMALHGGFIPYGGTFLTFSDYSRNAIRMAALMKQRVIHVFTHDSIGLGEDGPTHQSVEHVPSLRLIPGLDVWRPADGRETFVAWQQALQREDGPSALALSRQNLPALTGAVPAEHIARGGYVLADADGNADADADANGNPDVDADGGGGGGGARAVIVATGSELQLAMRAHEALASVGIATRVVSMPCTAVFDRQPRAWRDRVLPPQLPAVAVEAAHPDFWHKYVGREGRVIGIASFGESAPAAALYAHFGITAQQVEQAVRELLETTS